MVSIKDIAKRTGYSVSTVSRVINGTGYVSQEAKHKILEVVKELNYQPNSIARSMITKQSKLIGLMIPHINSPFFTGLSTSVEEEARNLGYNVILCHTQENSKIERDYLKVLMERRVDGVIVVPVGETFKHFNNVSKSLPIIFVGRSGENLNINSVEVDNIEGSRKVIEHLLELNHRKIGIINGLMYLSTGKKRWKGVQEAFDNKGLELDPKLVVEGDFTAIGGYKCTKKLLSLKNKPSAIFTANHLTALGVLKAAKELGLSIPDDLAVASFDGFEDSPDINNYVEPKITANIHSTPDMARIAINQLHLDVINMMKKKGENNAINTLISMDFVERESTMGRK